MQGECLVLYPIDAKATLICKKRNFSRFVNLFLLLVVTTVC